MGSLGLLLSFLWDLARAHPTAAMVAGALGLVWVAIHARPRLDSSYERDYPAAWSAAKRRLAALDRERRGTSEPCCDACILWRALAAVPVVGAVVRLILRGRLQWHHWRYPDEPGGEERIHMSRLCTDVWPDHHGDADKWRRAAESIPLVGRWGWAIAKPAFLATALICQLVMTLGIAAGIVAGLWFGAPPAADFIAQHVTIQ